jgi:hypothetical protein
MKVPDAADSATVGTSDSVTVAAAASAGTLSLASTATITFSGGATLAVSNSTLAGSLDVGSATLQGNGTLTVAGAFHKGVMPGGDTMFILDSVDLVLNGDAVMDGGVISICQAGDPPSDPTLHINADFTVAEGANSFSFFNCSSSGARVRVGPAGHLIKAAGGQMTSDTAIENDGTLTVQTGTLLLKGGTASSLGATSDGDYLADAGATLEFQGGSPPAIAGRLGGAGTIHVNTLDVDMLAGSVVDPAVLQVSGFLRLRGTAPVTLPALELTGGVIDGDRPVAVDEMDVTAGALQGDLTLTVPPGGSFTKTTGGTLFIRNNPALDSADLVLDADASLVDGQICVSRSGDDPDLPGLHINQDFTIGSGAPAGAFQCGPQFDTLIHLNGPDGHLSKAGPGTTNFNDLDLAGGTLSVASGQTFVFANTYAQSGGLTDIAAGGILQAAPTLTGGVLRGAGQITGNLTNDGGTVRPGTSPGTLTVTGNYSQGASGTLETEIQGTTPGTQFDRLAVNGSATLDGTLAIVNAPAFTPELTDTFKILTAGSRSGEFATLTGTQANGRTYSARYDSDGVTLELQETLPSNTGAPSIPPSPRVGETISCNPGTWTGSPSFAFAWRRDGTPIAGADEQTYTVASADVGRDLVCRVTATNAAGSATADSNVARAVAPQPTPTPTPTVAPSPTPAPASTPAPARPARQRTVPIEQVASLPSARRCVSRRRFRIRLRAPRGDKLRRAEVRVNGKRVRVVRGRRLTAPVDLRGLPRGRFKVEIRVATLSGRRLRGTRRYRTCVPKRGVGRR